MKCLTTRHGECRRFDTSPNTRRIILPVAMFGVYNILEVRSSALELNLVIAGALFVFINERVRW